MQLSVSDVAMQLDVTEETVWGWIREGAIPFLRVNEQYRLSSSEVLEWAIARGHKLSAQGLRHARGHGATLAQALQAGGVHTLERPQTRHALLTLLVEACTGLTAAEKNTVKDLLLASESLGPTGLGEGIAIPHVRTPIVTRGAPAAVATWYLEHPVDYFHAPDGKPVHTLFFVATPTTRAHLHFVSELMMALHDEAFRQALEDRAPLERLVAEAARVDVAAAELAEAGAAVRGQR